MMEARRVERPKTRVVLCADDYGMNEGVSEAIVVLAGAGRISATSCMTNAPGWPASARALAPLRDRIAIGLHLTLTWGRPLAPMPVFAPDGSMPELGDVMARALTFRVARHEVEAEIERQIEAFVGAFGRDPDFVDGHQHIHVLPVIRDALLSVLARRGLAGHLWLRDPSDRLGSIMARRLAWAKALLVHGLARGFRMAAQRAGFATNEGFSGFSAFDPSRPVGRDMDRYLMRLGPRPLVMCHPGRPGSGDAADEIAAARQREFDYLTSPVFGEALASRGLVLVPNPASLAHPGASRDPGPGPRLSPG
jgi:predicted glycoside hydrolase/deacetylase ChbG (UPF0249 family)